MNQTLVHCLQFPTTTSPTVAKLIKHRELHLQSLKQKFGLGLEQDEAPSKE
jgi:hypothetical protein